MSLPVWIEIHVDDEVLSQDPARFVEARALILSLAELAEDRGAVLNFRFRESFATLSVGDGVLPLLAQRGHEVGVHAHGRRIREAAEAVRGTGVVPAAIVPGLVQAGRLRRSQVLRSARRLGFVLVTDHGARRTWSYEGLFPRMEEGVRVMAPTVDPMAWGLYEQHGRRRPIEAEHIGRLRGLETQAEAHGAQYFGFAVHEHDFCPPGELRPMTASLDAFASYLDLRMGRASELRLEPFPAAQTDLGAVASRAGSMFRRMKSRLQKEEAPTTLRVADGRRIVHATVVPPRLRAMIVASHAGDEGGRGLGLGPMGLAVSTLTDMGMGVVLFDRAGTGASEPAGPLSPGNPAHVADVEAALAHARTFDVPVIALSWSAGIIPVLKSAPPPDALVDCEGPADRWSLVPPQGNELSELDPWNDEAWSGREPVALLGSWDKPYARVQATPDHVHGPIWEHARRMVEAVRSTGAPVLFEPPLEGPLHRHPGATIRAIEWAVSHAG